MELLPGFKVVKILKQTKEIGKGEFIRIDDCERSGATKLSAFKSRC